MRNMSEPIIICGDGRISRTGLEDRSRRAAGLFAAAGIGAGSSVAVLLPNRIAFIEAMLGPQHIGAYAVPFKWHFAPAEIASIRSAETHVGKGCISTLRVWCSL